MLPEVAIGEICKKKMEDQTTDDWLPPGWKVEVRQRRNGKKDKVSVNWLFQSIKKTQFQDYFFFAAILFHIKVLALDM